MPDVIPPMPPAHPETLFELNLEANGGVLAPRTIDELAGWVQNEISFWGWFNSTQVGSHREPIAIGYHSLALASGQITEARQHQHSNPVHFAQRVNEIRNQLSAAYVTTRLPHSSSKLGKRIEEMRKADAIKAVAYLYTQMPNNRNYTFDARDISSWTGFLEGITELGAITMIPKSILRSATASIEELQAKSAALISEKRNELDALHRAYEGFAKSLATKDQAHTETFNEFIGNNRSAHDELVDAHIERMNGIEATFREKMALRGPIEYWKKRQEHHETYSGVLGLLSFFLILVGGGGLAWWSVNIFGNIPDGKAPAPWQIATLAIIAVFLTWGIRLVIRLFLSHSHLRTDAAERVVMTQTYLALLEDKKLSEESDRSLILGALFRPTSDGMVKDENIPHPMLDALTRLGGKNG